MSSKATLCFTEASGKLSTGKIREGEYFRQVLAHYRGVRHPGDNDLSYRNEKQIGHFAISFITHSIRQTTLEKIYAPLSTRSTTALSRLFEACAIGNVKRLETQFRATTTREGVPVSLFIQPLAVVAAVKGRTECFRFCLDKGANIEDYCLSQAIEEVGIRQSDLEMMELLYEKNWKRLVISNTFRSEIASKLIRHPRGGEAKIVQWLLDHGATLQKNDIRVSVLAGGVDEYFMPILISANTEAATVFGSVHTAISACNPEAVKQLLDAGASPNGRGGGIFDEREGLADTPLIEAITPSKMEDGYSSSNVKDRLAIARLLLEHGVNLKAVGLRGDTAIQRANKFGGKLFMDLLEEFGAYSDDNPRPSKRHRVARELQHLT
jgi:hypothetical protein